jgi:hypothetical protein
MLPPVVVLFMIILLRTIVMDVALLATSLELRVSPLEVRAELRAELLCLLKRQARAPLSVLSVAPVLSIAGTNASVT